MATLVEILGAASRNHGFLLNSEVESLGALDPDRPLLIRCNAGRLVVPAQYCRVCADAIDAAGRGRGDWVRDISLPSTDPVFNGGGFGRVTPEPLQPPCKVRLPVPALPAVNAYGGCSFNCSSAWDDCVSDADPGL